MQGTDHGDGVPWGGQRTADLPVRVETVENDGSAGPQQEQSDGVDGARSEHGALARRDLDILSSEAKERGQANVGAAGGEDGHGASVNQDGPGTEEEGNQTPQRALPAQEPYRVNTKARVPPEWSRVLNPCGRQGGGGVPPTQQRGTPPCDWAQDEEGGGPSPSSARNLRAGRRGWGTGRAHPPRSGQTQRKKGPPKRQCLIPAHGIPVREGGDSPN